MFCQNIQAFVEPLEPVNYLVTLRTERYGYQFTLAEPDVVHAEHGGTQPLVDLYMKTQACCRELLRAERTGKLPTP